MSKSATLIQRLERVLIEIAESPELTIAQRLDATRQLAAIKRSNPPRQRPGKHAKERSQAMFGAK